MTARVLAVLAVLVVVLGHLVTPYLVAVVAAEVLLFALACVALGWLLASRPVPRVAARKAGQG